MRPEGVGDDEKIAGLSQEPAAVADIGGTFTDLLWIDWDGRLRADKALTTPDDYARAIVSGLERLDRASASSFSALRRFVHGTTIATNTIIERAGARVGLVTTAGCRDILEIGRIRTPRLYDIQWEKPAPLVERAMRFEVNERMSSDGSTIEPVRADELNALAERIAACELEGVAVCLLNAYANDEHEQIVATAVSEAVGGVPVSVATELLPEIGEYERMSTVVVNAYLRPRVGRYLEALQDQLTALGLTCPLLVMQSDGSLLTVRAASIRPINIVESGPAGGVAAAAAWADEPNMITFDMGGTTAKAAVVVDGKPGQTHELVLQPGITAPSRLISGGGFVVRTPSIDIAEVGAGGGSIAWIDAGGALQVGPQSAGAVPGPACYGRGGTDPTVTDANVVLGYIDPSALADEELRPIAEAAREAVHERIAKPLDLRLEDAALGIHVIANARMMRAIKHVTTERGVDPRSMALIAFGGSGPVHAASLARELGIGHVTVPPLPGLFSAIGLMLSRVSRGYSQSYFAQTSTVTSSDIRAVMTVLRDRAFAELQADGFDRELVTIDTSLAVRYTGQRYDIDVPSERAEAVDQDELARVVEEFHQSHERLYGRADRTAATEVTAVRLRATVSRAASDLMAMLSSTTRAADSENRLEARSRPAYFGEPYGWMKTRVFARGDLGSDRIPGPLIIEDYGATIVVPPSASAETDAVGGVHIAPMSAKE